MAVLLCFSAFFSGSEAALFYMNRLDCDAFRSGNRAQRVAVALLDNPDRLLTAVLFWNLVINVLYFAIASLSSLKLEREGRLAEAGGLTVGALLAIVFLGEMLPKNLAVLRTRFFAALLAIPLAAMVRVLDPIIPMLRLANLLSRRLLWPSFRPEPYLELSDLERAVDMSTTDAALIEQEKTVLQSIVSLSDISVEELMRPRTKLMTFRPPVKLSDVQGQFPPSGYILVTEPDSDEIAGSVALADLINEPTGALVSERVAYVPWSTTAAMALSELRRTDRRVVVVVNEFGETIGVLTMEDMLDTIFAESPSRSARLLNREPIREVSPGCWHVTGMTRLRRLARHFGLGEIDSKSVTLAGAVSEALEHVPAEGDQCVVGPFRVQVLAVPERGQMLAEIRILPGMEPST